MVNLRDWRKKHGLTQQALAEALGLTNSAITKYEKGAQRPRTDVAKRIEAFTKGDVTAASLMGLEESKRPRSLREDAAAFGDAAKLTIELRLSSRQERFLREGGIDIAAIARAGAEKAIKTAEAKAWAEANREAIDAYNAWIDKHGTLAEQLGLI